MMTLRLVLIFLLSGLRPIPVPVPQRSRVRRAAVSRPTDPIEHLLACFERLYLEWRNAKPPEPGTPAAPAITAAPPRPAPAPRRPDRFAHPLPRSPRPAIPSPARPRALSPKHRRSHPPPAPRKISPGPTSYRITNISFRLRTYYL